MHWITFLAVYKQWTLYTAVDFHWNHLESRTNKKKTHKKKKKKSVFLVKSQIQLPNSTFRKNPTNIVRTSVDLGHTIVYARTPDASMFLNSKSHFLWITKQQRLSLRCGEKMNSVVCFPFTGAGLSFDFLLLYFCYVEYGIELFIVAIVPCLRTSSYSQRKLVPHQNKLWAVQITHVRTLEIWVNRNSQIITSFVF